MFKYPLAVTIDTNIFDAAKFDLSDNSTIRLLENYVKKGKIKVILSEIVVRESKKHISNQVNITFLILLFVVCYDLKQNSQLLEK